MRSASCMRLRLEPLEVRETPTAGAVESFDQVVTPGLPGGWKAWNSDGAGPFSTAPQTGADGSIGLVTAGGSRDSSRAWTGTIQPGDTGAAADVLLSSLIPTSIFVRGSNLDTVKPTYLAATITRGVNLSVVEVVDGAPKSLGSLTSPPSAYFSGKWAEVSIIPTGNSVAVQVIRQDTGQYLNSRGTWQAEAANALVVSTSLPSSDGLVGVGRSAAYSGSASFDNFEIIPPASTPAPAPAATPGVQQSFDTLAPGASPADWSVWSSGAPSTFAASSSRALSPANGFSSNGGSTSADRAWANAILPADVTASAAIYLNSLIPAQLFIRGSNLNTASPSYYAVTLTRGLEAQLVKVVNGATTVLGELKSSGYFSSQWLRASMSAVGNEIRVSLYRTDTQQWLDGGGNWTNSPDFAFDLKDSAIAGGGQAGVARAARYSGAVAFDDFSAEPASNASGPTVAISADSTGNVQGTVTFTADVSGAADRIEFLMNNRVLAMAAASPASWTFDSTTVANGAYTLVVRAFDSAGNFGESSYAFTVANPNASPVPKPTIPQHYPWIRVAELAYGGTPITNPLEQNLLKNSVDLVIPNPAYLSAIQAASPDTPQLIYSNVSNLYEGLLASWIDYSRKNAINPELAFYHVTQATPFVGASPSSKPVNWFWGGYQNVNGTITDVTSALRGGRSFNVNFGAAGTWTAIGYLDPFREMNVTLAASAGAGWSGAWEYVSAVDANGNPTAWKPLPLNADGTSGMTRSGRITFDPPADWQPASVGGSTREFFVRLRSTAGSTAQAPQLKTVFGRDYVNAVAHGGTSGVIPAFDYSADKNHDGYLDDAEYANRASGKDARFVYETRLFYPYYGQMRFVTNPSSPQVRAWAAGYATSLMEANPTADGIFMDNELGKIPFSGVPVLEPTAAFSTDSGALIAAVNRAIAPRWVMSNTAGGGASAGPIAAGSAAVLEESLLRPLDSNWSEVGDTANLVAGRLAASGSPYVVLDSLANGGSPTDSRTQLATLAEYYLMADPQRTMLMFYGGASPSSSWVQHWSQAVTVNVGQPTGSMQVFASGIDPSNSRLSYKVYSRAYQNGLVLYKPLSYAQGVGEGTLADATATSVPLGGNYRQVNADGALGPVISSLSLRNGEGAVLIKA